MGIKEVIFILTILFLAEIWPTEAKVLVKLPTGTVRGNFEISPKGLKYASFKGIPYAEPPIGKLRFKEPVPLSKPWPGIWEADKLHVCLQYSHWEQEGEDYKVLGDEDCLYLNVFSPNVDSEANLDVIVNIHGGGFMWGKPHMFGERYQIDKNVVFVSMNYRVGPLGFLSTGDDIVPGNNGMKDQSLALKWIKENIRQFGGNPDSITIVGLSAGGASVHFHYLSPLSKGLFNRGISMSGSALCPWALQETPLLKAKMLAERVGCNLHSVKDMIECLRQRPATQLVEKVKIFQVFQYNPFSPFALVVEKESKSAFLPDYPNELLKTGRVYDVPWLASVTSEEGLYPAADFVSQPRVLDEIEHRWHEFASALLDYNFSTPIQQHKSLTEKVKNYYYQEKEISVHNSAPLVQMIGDRHFVVPVEKAALLQAEVNKQPVYFYYFTYRGTHSFSELRADKENYGVSHGDDTLYILSNDSLEPEGTDDEQMLTAMLGVWNSFCKTNKPKFYDTDWKPVSKKGDSLTYLHIESPKKQTLKTVETLGHRQFWESLKLDEHQPTRDLNDEL